MNVVTDVIRVIVVVPTVVLAVTVLLAVRVAVAEIVLVVLVVRLKFAVIVEVVLNVLVLGVIVTVDVMVLLERDGQAAAVPMVIFEKRGSVLSLIYPWSKSTGLAHRRGETGVFPDAK